MKLRSTATLLTLAAVAALSAGQQARAQGPVGPQPGGPQGVLPAYATDGPMVDAHGDRAVLPASHGAPCPPGGYGPGGGMMGGGPASLGAFGGGAAMNTEQCGPHYFDFSAEYVRYELDDDPIGGVISTEGFPNDISNIEPVISGGDLDAGDANGYRLIGRLDVGALSVFEIGYTGLYDTNNDEVTALGGSANPNSTETLYSVFSNFGFNDGITGGTVTGPAFRETDNALEHRVGFESELHSVEASYRRYWVGYSPRVSGTLLIGFRYTSLEEALSFFSRSDLGTADIRVEAANHLAGCQVGGDAWMTLFQGFRIGVENKLGLYNNSFDGAVSTAFGGSSTNTDSAAAQSGDTAAFISELKVMAVANLTPSLSLRGGYELLYISDVFRAGDNLLANPPYGGAGSSLSKGEALYNGWSIGGEYVY
ncbi:MAG: BBP7 family outer membrane beta-barrel protein [Planctomycetota bacterium]